MDRPVSSAAKECEDIFVNNVARDDTGRYSVSLPFSSDPAELGDSYESANSRRYVSFERKLSAAPQVRAEYRIE